MYKKLDRGLEDSNANYFYGREINFILRTRNAILTIDERNWEIFGSYYVVLLLHAVQEMRRYARWIL